ncbi:penicillin acylase family protein [Actinoplanes sp. NPDC049265]|uniref:penicillin acylase family protein n=1 Tax=Actinoplanes sp. NPDC049265 TaxID=3363902 RepID=UPI00371FEB90
MTTAATSQEVRAGGLRAVITHRPDAGTVIRAEDWDGAVLGLGFQMAIDRAGQMDFLRRTASGTLAQLVGPAAVEADVRQRRLGLTAVAQRSVALLPAGQATTLDAFVRGVRAGLRHRGSPMTWSAADTLQVAQVLFQSMGSDGSELRMTEVMRRSLPPEVAAFLLDGADEYATGPDGRSIAHASAPMPVTQLRALFQEPPGSGQDRVVVGARPAGSNAWAVRTATGAVLANDMHLQLTDPPLMYPARMVVGGGYACGVTVPGLPALVAGSNGRVAWGLTRLPADNADLRPLSADEARRVQVREETIEVRGGPPVRLEVADSPWGPLTEPLAGEPVAFTSTLLDPAALDLGLLDLYRASDLDSAMAIVNRSGLPPVNAVLADAAGRVGWTVGGRFPSRPAVGSRGFSSTAEPVHAPRVAPGDLPRVADPGSGTVINCNNGSAEVRAAGIAWNLPSGVRARRVADRLAGAEVGVAGSLALQLDTEASLFEFYRALALRQLPAAPRTEALREIRADVTAWGGTADAGERGLALLTLFRDLMREDLIAAATRPARRLDPRFSYCFAGAEGPLRQLIGGLADGLVPAPWRNGREFVVGQLLIARRALLRETGLDRLPRWGELNRLTLAPLAAYPPQVVGIALAGCAESVRVAQPDFGAAMRLVAVPGRPDVGSLSIPGGSREAEDTAAAIRDWAGGRGQPLLPPAAG